MANTVIQLKYSNTTNTPVTLNLGEPAYSNSSNKLFIGEANGGISTIGGKYFTALIDAATSANTAGAIVKRGSLGEFSTTFVQGNLHGNANTATILQTARDIGLAGDATGNVSFDGSQNVTLTVDLSDTGVSAGTYGNASIVPVFTVDAEGRISSVTNTAISISGGASTLNIASDTGSGNLNLTTETLTIAGRDGLASIYVDANNTVLLDVDNTVIRTTGGQTITGALTVTGNLIVSGNTVTQDVEILKVEDSLIQLAANNAADAVDIGFFGQYNDGSTKYTGLIRDASDSGKFKLVTAGTMKPTDANTFESGSFSTATLVANVETSNIYSSGVNILTTISGTATVANAAFDKANAASLHANSAFNLANGTAIIANTDFTTISAAPGTYANASIIPVITLTGNGRVSSIVNTSIAIDTAAITSGTLGVTRGGTGFASYTANGVIVGGTTSTSALISVASSTEGHVLQISSSGVPTFAHLNGGSF